MTPSAASADEALARRRTPERPALARRLEASGCWMICRHDARLPGGPRAPRAGEPRASSAAATGRCPRLDRAPVTIVGARRAGAYGREVAEGLGCGLAAAGVHVVSGLALGIDSAAHRGALAAAGRGLAVLGGGADAPIRAAPPASTGGSDRRRRRRDLGAAAGQRPSRRWMFPARNRLMAALGELTVVVEAAERSGSLITAEMAIDCGRTVGAVPGPVNSWRSSGTNRCCVDGAALDPRRRRRARRSCSGPVAPRLAVRRAAGARSRQELGGARRGRARRADRRRDRGRARRLGAGDCAVALARLELAGYVEADFAGRLRRGRCSSGAGAGRP